MYAALATGSYSTLGIGMASLVMFGGSKRSSCRDPGAHVDNNELPSFGAAGNRLLLRSIGRRSAGGSHPRRSGVPAWLPLHWATSHVDSISIATLAC